MTDAEQRLLYALAGMANQYLTRHDTEELDNLSISAGEEALEVLTEYGLVTMEAGQVRFGEWTATGHALLNSK